MKKEEILALGMFSISLIVFALAVSDHSGARLAGLMFQGEEQAVEDPWPVFSMTYCAETGQEVILQDLPAGSYAMVAQIGVGGAGACSFSDDGQNWHSDWTSISGELHLRGCSCLLLVGYQ